MDARIYRPAKTATQSGRANTQRWVLEFEPAGRREIDDLMGWTGSGDMRAQVKLSFPSKEEAVAYARQKKLAYVVEEPQTRRIRPKSYADNFIRRT